MTASSCWSRRTTGHCAWRSVAVSEGALTDALSSRIINDTIAPLFKQGDFYGGINAGLDQVMRVIDGEPLPAAGPEMASHRQRNLRGRC